MPVPRGHLLDELATAYVQAVAAVAGATIAGSRDYGVDGVLHQIELVQSDQATDFIPSGFPVDFQLKATTVAEIGKDRVQYRLTRDAIESMLRHRRKGSRNDRCDG